MNIVFPQILFYSINFFVVLAVLSALLYKPLLKLFDERARRIEEGQKAAAEAMEGQAQIAELKAKTQKELEKERSQIMAAAVQEAEVEKNRIIEEAQVKAQALLTAQQDKWHAESVTRVASLHDTLATAVVVAAEQVLAQKLSQRDQTELVTKELDTALQWLKA